jgi:hypothetical protein
MEPFEKETPSQDSQEKPKDENEIKSYYRNTFVALYAIIKIC